MKIYTTYEVKIKHYNHIFKETVELYRKAVDYLIMVCYENWDKLSEIRRDNLYRFVQRTLWRLKRGRATVLFFYLVQSICSLQKKVETRIETEKIFTWKNMKNLWKNECHFIDKIFQTMIQICKRREKL